MSYLISGGGSNHSGGSSGGGEGGGGGERGGMRKARTGVSGCSGIWGPEKPVF